VPEQLHFTTKVLGPLAAYKLINYQVTQTLRSKESSITKVIQGGLVKIGDQVEVMLDNIKIEMAEFVIMDAVTWVNLTTKDAARGGFDSLEDLEKALQRAGYRFKPIDMYQLYRVQFSWLTDLADGPISNCWATDIVGDGNVLTGGFIDYIEVSIQGDSFCLREM